MPVGAFVLLVRAGKGNQCLAARHDRFPRSEIPAAAKLMPGRDIADHQDLREIQKSIYTFLYSHVRTCSKTHATHSNCMLSCRTLICTSDDSVGMPTGKARERGGSCPSLGLLRALDHIAARGNHENFPQKKAGSDQIEDVKMPTTLVTRRQSRNTTSKKNPVRPVSVPTTASLLQLPGYGLDLPRTTKFFKKTCAASYVQMGLQLSNKEGRESDSEL